MDKKTKEFIESQDWPDFLKNKAKMIAQARVERELDPMDSTEWENWALHNGGSKT